MGTSTSLRVFMSQEDVHYDGGLVAGARVLGLFGDAGTALLLANDGVEGLLACYEEVQFLRPVFAGDTIDVTATVKSQGRTSRRLHFEARVGGEPVCTAVAVAIAKPLDPHGGASGR
jgi:3-aminobutyryl-CoA ammonia-lyase